ncbi:unnamed protein product [Effrenium voratum]|uniref:Uncharacterized protein n=1 Tax=Effrenium voratum TaxID=2562239 RepID=A0AA36I4F5_9DINO|nr:unnamed protein product [Effrenium voratum]
MWGQSKELKAVTAKLEAWAQDTFGGSDYLSKLFGGNPAALKDTFQTLLVRLDKLQPQHIFTRHATQATVPSPDDESVELYLNPWHLGYEPCFSLKGPSKMVYILRLFREFLERPFDSASNPILINFKGLQPGAPIPSFQVSISIGFTKSIAMKLILLGAIQTNLTDGELTLLAPHLRAMFAFKCIYRSTGNAKEDRFRALQEKFSESSRPRPDPVQISGILLQQCVEEGRAWKDGSGDLIAQFNAGSGVDCKRLSDLEQTVVTMYPNLMQESQELIAYHWSNYPAKNSGLTYKQLACEQVRCGSKPRIDCELWRSILSTDMVKVHWFVARRVRYFLHKLGDAKRLRKRVNLTANAASFRDQKDDETCWAITCLFVHYLPAFKELLTAAQMDSLGNKFIRGYLDMELVEKYRVADPQLTASSFRMLQEFGVKSGVAIKIDEAKADLDLQKAELNTAIAKLNKEQKKFLDFKESMANFQRAGLGLQAELVDKQKASQRAAVEVHQETHYPLRDLAELGHATTFVESCANRFANEAGIADEECHRIFWLNSSTLGCDAVKNTIEAIKEFSGHIASDPRRSCMIIAAPTTGAFGNEYSEHDVHEQALKILDALRDVDNRLLVREITVVFDPSTIPAQSKRPANHKFYMAVSDQVGTDKELLSIYSKSVLWRRQTVPCTKQSAQCIMNPIRNYVDPRRDFSTAGSTGPGDVSRPARRKQWLSGWTLPAAFLDGIWLSMGKGRNSMVAFIDVFAYDHSTAECVMRRSSNSTEPMHLWIGTCWAEANTRDDHQQGKRVENQKISRWLLVAVRRRLQNMAEQSIMKIPNWEALAQFVDNRTTPVLQESDFQVTFPSGADTLPFTQKFLNVMSEKLVTDDLKEQWAQVVQDHNALYNPQGKAYDGTKRAAEGGSADGPMTKKQKTKEVVTVEDSLEDIKKKHKVTAFAYGGGQVVIASDGHMWFAAGEAKATLSPMDPPLALVFGSFKINEDAKKIMQGKAFYYEVGFSNDEVMGHFRKGEEPGESAETLRSFLSKLESGGKDISSLEIACHKVEPKIEKDAAGDVTKRAFEVKDASAIVFSPQPAPRKVASSKPPTWEDAGSLLFAASSSVLEEFKKQELIVLGQRWAVTSSEQSWGMNPDKPGLYPACELEVPAGKIAKLV